MILLRFFYSLLFHIPYLSCHFSVCHLSASSFAIPRILLISWLSLEELLIMWFLLPAPDFHHHRFSTDHFLESLTGSWSSPLLCPVNVSQTIHIITHCAKLARQPGTPRLVQAGGGGPLRGWAHVHSDGHTVTPDRRG